MMKRTTPLLALAVCLALLAAACSDGGGIVSLPGSESLPTTTEPTPSTSGSGDVITVSERDDLISLQPHPIRSISNGENGSSVIVEFLGGMGTCTGYIATATLTDDEVFVELTQGLHPNIAAMTCPMGEESKEIVIELGQPVGDRALRFDPDVAADGPGDGELTGPVLDPADYIGLPYDEGVALAESNGFSSTRLMRDGDEFFAGTADFRPDRLNFEIDDGIVTVVTPG